MRTHADAPGCTRSSTPQSSAAHEQVLKPVQRQTLFPQPSVESLDVRVLHWLAGLNVHQLDLPFHAPRQKMPARPLRPVVAANCFRPSALGHDPLQYSHHSPTVETGVHFQHSRVYASTTLSTRITRPHSTTSCTKSSAHSWFAAVRASSGCPRARNVSASSAGSSPLPPDKPDALACGSHALPSGPTKHAVAIREARLLPRQLRQPRSQRLIAAPALVAIARYRHRHQSARAAG
jgi:hypothetical protein